VLNAHRLHQHECPQSTPDRPGCSCRPELFYDLYGRYAVDTFLLHLKGRHLEYHERYLDYLLRLSIQNKPENELKKDIWHIQKVIRDVYGMGDDLIL
jgi:hypothetical protein